MSERGALAEQFESLPQQAEASRLGMWVFLASELMLFGGLFLGYTVYRHIYPAAFATASRETNLWYGTFNTVVLLTSSFTMALAVHAASDGRNKACGRFLLGTIFLAVIFLVLKGFEYTEDFHQHLFPGLQFNDAGRPHTVIFFLFYWMMTALHGLHILIGISLLGGVAWMCRRGRFSASYHNPVEIVGLYWHFVDIVWIFLYPILYLVDRHS